MKTAQVPGTGDAAGPDGMIDALVQASFLTMAVLSRIGADNDLSLTQLRVLGILRDRRPRMTALADYLGLEKSTLSGLIDRAEKRGLVERAPSATDRRAVDVFLSKAGTELSGRLYGRLRAELAPLLSGVAPGDQARLRELLEQLIGGREP